MNPSIPAGLDLDGPPKPPSGAWTAIDSGADRRPDIEGLRGLAVLAVLAVHMLPESIRGGALGVDIFFVLSGYLITQSVLRSLGSRGSRWQAFYARRVRRIVPSLVVVLLASLAFAVLFTPPLEAQRVGRDVAGAAVFGSNLLLWMDRQGLDATSDVRPLLHLWALGTLAPFVLLWPLALTAAVRRGWPIALLIVCLLLPSLAWHLAFAAEAPAAGIFLPGSRLWEPMLGAWLAALTTASAAGTAGGQRAWLPGWQVRDRALADRWAGAGLVLLLLAAGSIDAADRSSGWWALLPATGAVALLAAGPQAWVSRHLLAHPILRFYGTISHPLYLWHWPLLCFPALLGSPLTNELRVLVLIASVILATLTWEFVEKPGQGGAPSRRQAGLLLAVLLLTGLCGWLVMNTGGLAATYPVAPGYFAVPAL